MVPLRILYYTLHDLALPSAPTSHVRATVTGLRERGHLLTVIGTTSDPGATRDLDVLDCGAFLTDPGFIRRMWRARGAARRAARHLARLADFHDLMYARHFTAGRVAPAALPLIYEINGLLVPELRGDGTLPRRLAARLADRELRRTFARARAVVAVSDGLRQDAMQAYGVPGAQVTTIPNGVDTRRIHPSAPDVGRRIRDSWGFPPGALVAGIVGSFGLRQRVDWLFAAWPRVRERFPDAYIVLVGPGLEDGRWAAAARACGLGACVVCCPPVPETLLSDVYAGMDVSLQLLASYGATAQHGSSIKVRTGLAAGRPVIATAHPGLGFLETEDIGRLVPEADSVALADAIRLYFADAEHRAETGVRARRYAEHHLDWSSGVEQVEAVLKGALQHRGGTGPG